MRKAQVLGLVFWRGGLLLAGAAGLFYGAQELLRYVDLPGVLQVAGALALSGLGLVLISIVLENQEDAREGKELES